MNTQEIEIGLKPGDRVMQSRGDGPIGTVRRVRVETMRASIKDSGREPPGVTVTVLWDNGTLSHFIPDGLKKV